MRSQAGYVSAVPDDGGPWLLSRRWYLTFITLIVWLAATFVAWRNNMLHVPKTLFIAFP